MVLPASLSDTDTDNFSSMGATSSPPSSPPAPAEPVVGDEEAFTEDLAMIEAEERRAKKANALEEERRLAAARRRQQKKAATKAEREAKARELDELLRQSAAFSDILTKKTQVLGRVGSGFDGKALGEHDLKMAEQPKCLVGGKMRDYQLEGLTWMLEICLQNMSGILADEMGLGKTVQTISLIALLREQESYLGPHLIVAPLSTLSNWINEFHHWTPTIPVVMYHGTPQQRKEIFKDGIQKHLVKGRPTDKFPVVCTSYEIILRDRADLAKINWEFIIIDEGHRMKNFDSKLFRELQAFRSATRFLITGTPLQNNLKELWSLLNFLMPKIFTDWEAFSSWFDFSELQDEQGTEGFIEDRTKQDLVKKIHLVLQPLLLRRVKADVASYLPKKREYILYAPMTKEQTDLYNAINDKNIDTRAYLESKIIEHFTQVAASKAAQEAEQKIKKEEKGAEVVEAKQKDTRTSRAKGAKETTKRTSSRQEVMVEKAIPLRQSPRAKKTEDGIPAPSKTKNAFALMMGKRLQALVAPVIPPPSSGLDPAVAVTGRASHSSKRLTSTSFPASDTLEVPSSTGKAAAVGKRKVSPVSEESLSKSAKSSRQSTPSKISTPSVPRSLSRASRQRKTYREADASDEDLMSDDEFEASLRKEYEAVAGEGNGKGDASGTLSAEEKERLQTLELAKREVAQKKLGNPLMQLRLVCNSPHNFYNPWASLAGTDERPVDEAIVMASGKMLLLDRLLPALFERGHKVLIFSQFKTQLDILEAYCAELRGWNVCRIDGSVAHTDRQDQIDLFNSDPKHRLFLLSTRAGGQGINLASADTVILFDSDWNPQQDLQAQDRAHRIGQKRPVVVYRLATKGTVEEDLLMSADAKRRLEKLVIKKGGLRNLAQRKGGGNGAGGDDAEDVQEGDLDKETLRALLLKDGQVYKFSGDKEVLSDQDLDILCDRSEEAYAKAASGHGDADAFKVIETGANGITESFKKA